MDPYAVLGVDPGATPAQIREAFRKLVRRRHPDTSTGPAQVPDVNAVIEAYRILTDPAARARLDPAPEPPTAPSPPRGEWACPRCAGTGSESHRERCPGCAGTGEITEIGGGEATRSLCGACGGRGARDRPRLCSGCGGTGRVARRP
jgi:curved DNA-binding protein